MIETGLVEALDDSINRLNAGSTLADCLNRHTDYALELRPLLEAGQVVRQNQVSLTEAQQAADRQRFRFEQALATPIRPFPLMQLVRLAASLVLVFAFLVGGVGLAAESSLPGDALYNVKLFTETLRLQITGDATTLQAQFAERRLDEARQIVSLRRVAEVTLTGTVEMVFPDRLLIDGLAIQADTATILPGSRVEVHIVSTEQGELIAREIRVLQVPPIPSPSSDLSPTTTPVRDATATRQRNTVTPTLPTTDEANAANSCDEPPAGWTAYTVQAGDTLSELTVNTGGTLDTIIAANCLTDAGRIVVGTILFLPRQPVRSAATATEATSAVRPPTAVPTRPPQRDQAQEADRDEQRPPPGRDADGNHDRGNGDQRR